MDVWQFGSKWDRRFMGVAREISTWSKDQSSKVGAVVVGPNREIRSTGYNGLPRGVNDEVSARHDRSVKYLYFEHAERNAIYNAARVGLSLKDCAIYIYCANPFPPCADCARAIIQVGIVLVVYEQCVIPERWKQQCETALELLKEAGVETRMLLCANVNTTI